MAILSSCSTISYYGQSVSGQLQLLQARQDVQKLLLSSNTPIELKQKLKNISKIRDFASDVLGLPDNNSYRSFADIGRKYIVWNIFATSAFSLEPVLSCFAIVGCLSYRGYFKKDDALVYVKGLEDQNYDVYLGGVTAYSTLGWFDDPILNGMLQRNDIDLARLIFHELAHQQLYIKDDTEFNEAFADAVALIGLEIWLDENSTNEQRHEFSKQLERENQFVNLVFRYRDKLAQLFRSNLSESEKYKQKSLVFSELKDEYWKLRTSWGGYAEYDAWFQRQLNNAKLLAISTYRNLVPQFLAAYKLVGGDIQSFYSRIETLAKCDAQRRREILQSTTVRFSC